MGIWKENGTPFIDIPPAGTRFQLPATSALSNLKEDYSYHETRDRRHPLGVYNISVARICSKIKKCAQKMESYWSGADINAIEDEIIDYLELSIYAAAEHVDDLEYIAGTFFKSDRDASISPHVRWLKGQIKPLRDEISKITNTIKHAHGRVRIFEIEFIHDKNSINLIGFFIEGYKDGAAAPNPVLHSDGKKVFSITSYLWGILTFIYRSSDVLREFITRIGAYDGVEGGEDAGDFRSASYSLARLPAYAFDEEHPFVSTQWRFGWDRDDNSAVRSRIYGSISAPWSMSENGTFGDSRLRYAADGVSRSFSLVAPKNLRIQHWK